MSTPATIARPYAQAVFEIAGEEGTTESWSHMLALAAAMVAVPEMAACIANPEVDRGTIAAILADAGGDTIDANGRTLLRVLADSRRLKLLPWIVKRYEDLRAASERRACARVVAARPVSPEEASQLKTRLEAALGLTVLLDLAVDEDLLSGAVIRVGDRVIDNSAAGRLRGLAQHLG